MKTIIIGASAGLGRALAALLAKKGHDLCLVSSDERDLKSLASDLNLRYGHTVNYVQADLNQLDLESFKTTVEAKLGVVKNLLYIAGYSSSDDSGNLDDPSVKRLLNINMVSAVRIINAFLPELKNCEQGNIVGIGSTASARPRRHNSIYGAAKTGLEFYFGTLRHYLAFYPCSVQFYRVGYLETRMTFGMKLFFPKLKPEKAAEKIVDRLGKSRSLKYIPAWWLIIMTVYKTLPNFIHDRLDA